MNQKAHSQVVQAQFGEQANAYLNSAVHAQGSEFAALQAAVAGRADARLLDLGVDGVMTDRADVLAEVYARRGLWPQR